MNYSRKSNLMLLAFFIVPLAVIPLMGESAMLTPEVGECYGTMTASRETGFARITIAEPKTMIPPDGGCPLGQGSFSFAEHPVFDFWIRVKGHHALAFNVAFGSSGIGYPGYEGYADHALNIVDKQVGVDSLGDLNSLADGKWHHVVFDLALAVKNQLNAEPGEIKTAFLSLFDRQGSLSIFSNAKAEPIPETIDLRDMSLRSPKSAETYFNDLMLSADSSAAGESSKGERQYLIAGSIASRRTLDDTRLVVKGGSGEPNQELGRVEGHKEFTVLMAVPSGTSQVKVELRQSSGKLLAEKQVELQPEISYLRRATVHIIPNSHNDIGWLDTPEATANWRRDRVIGPAIPLLEKYPDYRYGMETNLFLMEYLERMPTQADTIHKLMAENRLAFGATYNQPYQSLWGGESLMRQLYYGRKWLKEHVGTDVDCVTAWGTDVPSVAMQMAQILAKSGVKYLMLGRFQPGIYTWSSPDGSKITMGSLGIYGRLAAYYTPPTSASVAMQVPGLLRGWDQFYADRHIPPEFPITDMTDYLPPNKDLIPLVGKWNDEAQQKYGSGVKLKFATGEEFMNAVTSDAASRFPEVQGEWPDVWLYIHGPTHHDLVSAGREAVWDLTSAEKFWTLRSLASRGSERYPTETFDQAWMAQIYPDHGFGGFNGDITDMVFQSKEETARRLGQTLLASSTQWIADHATPLDPADLKLVIFNPLSWDRSGPAWAEIPTPAGKDAEVVDAGGTIVPLQRVPQESGGAARYVLATNNIPAIGYQTYKVRFAPKAAEPAPTEAFKTGSYENEFYRLQFAPGGLKSIYDKQLGRELVDPQEFLAGEVFMLDSVGTGAGEFGETQQPSWKNIEKASQYQPTWRLIESGPVRTGWRFDQPFGQATVRLEVYAYTHSKRLDFDVKILHWSGEKYKEFRMAVPVRLAQAQVAYDVPYGVLEVGKDEIKGKPFEGWYSRPAGLIHPREVQDWVAASGSDFTVMMSSSVAVFDYLDSQEKNDRLTLLQPVLLASRRSCHSLGNWYLQKGDHQYQFSLTSFAGGWRNNIHFGNEVNGPFPAVAAPSELRAPALPGKAEPLPGVGSQLHRQRYQDGRQWTWSRSARLRGYG